MEDVLRTRFLNWETATPLVLPAGVLGTSFSSMLACAEAGAGFITTKSSTLTSRPGHHGPVVAPAPAGLLNAVGISNPGIGAVIEEVNDFTARCDTPIAVSLFADNVADFVELTRHVNDCTASAIELNLSCPNVSDEFGTPLAASPTTVAQIVESVCAVSRVPVIAKLSPNVTSVPIIAKAAEAAGAHAICAINTLGPGMSIDLATGRPVLANRTGGLSGPAIRPIAVRIVYELAQTVSVPIIGVGGVANWRDAAEMLLAGATMVGVGTAVYQDGAKTFRSIAAGLADYLKNREGIHAGTTHG